MDLLGGYGSSSSDDDNGPETTTKAPAAPAAPPINTNSNSTDGAAAADGGTLWARLPTPVVAAKKVIQLRLPMTLQPGDDSDEDDEADRARAAKRRCGGPTSRSRLMDFLPPPKAPLADANVSGLGGSAPLMRGHGNAGGTGGGTGPAAASSGRRTDTTSSPLPAAGDDAALYGSNDVYRAASGDDSDGEAAEPSTGYDQEAGGSLLVDEPAESHHETWQQDNGGQYSRAGQYNSSSGQAEASTAPVSGHAIFEEALRAEQQRVARARGNATVSSKAEPMFVEIKARDLRHVDAAKQAAAEGARGALGAEYALQLRASAKPFEGDKMAKRKHQIGTLFYNAKMKELERMETGASGMKTKSQTQAKYGW